MENFIEELFYGNIDPQAREYRKDRRAIKVLKNITDIEEKLTERLRGEDKDLFLDFCNGNSELTGEATLDAFIVGFRLGAKMFFDTFCSDDAPFESFLES